MQYRWSFERHAVVVSPPLDPVTVDQADSECVDGAAVGHLVDAVQANPMLAT